MRDLPFKDLKVVDLAWVVAGPLIGRALADYGATVVRVESSRRVDTARVIGPFPGGTTDIQQSALYENCNAGKLGLALDLSSIQGREVIRRLVAWADVLVESFSPGQMERWGLFYETLREIKPDLVMVSTSLMGQSGPYASFAGFGNVGAAMAGFQLLVGERDAMPVGPFGPFTDFVGPRFGLVTLLAALDHRRRTGEGCWLDVSQAEAGIQMLAPQIADYAVNGNVAMPNGNRDSQMAPHGVFRCAGGDDAWVAIAVRDDHDWQALAVAIEGPSLAADPRYATLQQRQHAEDELEALIAAWTAQRNAHDVQAILQAANVPVHLASGSADMLGDAQLVARRHFVGLDHPLMGTSTVETSRYRLSETPGPPTRAAPVYGRDNTFVLRELLGYDMDEIEVLERAGVLV